MEEDIIFGYNTSNKITTTKEMIYVQA